MHRMQDMVYVITLIALLSPINASAHSASDAFSIIPVLLIDFIVPVFITRSIVFYIYLSDTRIFFYNFWLVIFGSIPAIPLAYMLTYNGDLINAHNRSAVIIVYILLLLVWENGFFRYISRYKPAQVIKSKYWKATLVSSVAAYCITLIVQRIS